MADATPIGQVTTENYVARGVILATESVSDTFYPGGRTFIKIEFPEVTSATFGFLVQAYDGGPFQTLYDDAGNEKTIGTAFTAVRTILAPWLSSFYAFRVRSGTLASPVAQNANRSIVVSATRGSRIA
jgi:hypothetical protein